MDEKVLCAALWVKVGEKVIHSPKNIDKGFVICGYRHGNLYAILQAMNINPGFSNIEDGFLTSHNRFIDRKTARDLVLQTGQLSETQWGDELYSEDLY